MTHSPKDDNRHIDSYPARTKVGYGLAHTLDRDSKLAAVTAGYGDGYRRALARGGHVLVRGRRVAIVDLVSMNSMVVDVTDIADAAPGDEVVLFGKQGAEEITVEEMEIGELGNPRRSLHRVGRRKPRSGQRGRVRIGPDEARKEH